MAKPSGYTSTHTELLQLIEINFLILFTPESFIGYSMRQQTLFPKSTCSKETKFTFAPIPKRHAIYFILIWL